MSDHIKELVKRLNAGRILLLRADGDRDLDCQSNITTDTSMALADELKSAIDAIEAMAGEVERLTRSEAGLLKTLGLERRVKHAAQTERDRLAGEVERVSALLRASRADEAQLIRERDRLKAALQDCIDAYDFVIVNEYDRGWSSVSDAIHAARKALAGKTT